MPSVDGSNIKTLKNPKYLKIVYADPLNTADELAVSYKLRNHDFVSAWIERLDTAQKKIIKLMILADFMGSMIQKQKLIILYRVLIDVLIPLILLHLLLIEQ